jgi:hypothetical protein
MKLMILCTQINQHGLAYAKKCLGEMGEDSHCGVSDI